MRVYLAASWLRRTETRAHANDDAPTRQQREVVAALKRAGGVP